MRPPKLLMEALALGAVVAVLYGAALGAPAVFDDTHLVLSNPRVMDPGLLLRHALAPDGLGMRVLYLPTYAYRPVSEASFALVRAVAGEGLGPQRLVNLAIHWGAALLVLILTRQVLRLLGRSIPGLPWMAALWFVGHPMAAQAVTYVSQRFVSLLGLLFFACLHFYLKAMQASGPGEGRRAWWTAMGLGILSMGVKESAVTLPLWLGVAAWVLRRPGEPGRAGLGRWLPFAFISLIVPVQVLRAMQGGGWHRLRHYEDLTFFQTLGCQMQAFWDLLGLHLFPWHFHFHLTEPSVSAWAWLAAGGLLLLAGVVWGGWGTGPLLSLGIGWILAPQLLEFVAYAVVFHHRCYIGLLGGGLLFGSLAGRGRWARGMGILVLGCLATTTLRENALWTRPPAMQRRDIRSAPEAPKLRGAFAGHLLRQGKLHGALRRYQAILCHASAYESDFLGMAACLEALGRRDQALDVLKRAVQAFPHSNRCLITTAHMAHAQGERDLAEALVRQVLAHPQRPWTNDVHLAEVLDRMGRAEDAERLLRGVLAGGADVTEVWMALGNILARQGKREAARDAFQHALQLDPGLEAARRRLDALQETE